MLCLVIIRTSNYLCVKKVSYEFHMEQPLVKDIHEISTLSRCSESGRGFVKDITERGEYLLGSGPRI